MANTPKIIQISARDSTGLFALMDDGTLWYTATPLMPLGANPTDVSKCVWYQVPPIQVSVPSK